MGYSTGPSTWVAPRANWMKPCCRSSPCSPGAAWGCSSTCAARTKHGITVAQTAGIILNNDIWERVPIKTGESPTYFVLHNFLVEIGFVDWARAQGDNWLFAAAHEHADPSEYASKVMACLLQRARCA